MEKFMIAIETGIEFIAQFKTSLTPQTCAAFQARLPFISQVVRAHWSGQAVWIPLGDESFGFGYENATSYLAPGEIILYSGGLSETGILLAYGRVSFASMAGQLAGNHFLTITSDLDRLREETGNCVLWKGAQEIRFEQF